MKVVKASYEILTPISNTGEELKLIERAARTCYKSENLITQDSASKLIGNLIRNDHTAMLEHSFLSVKFICDRAIANEIVRHRIMSYAQESTRYCNYSKDKFGGEITCVKPYWLDEGDYDYTMWYKACCEAENNYFDFLQRGYSPEQARGVLPLCLKTELVVSGNYREWKHVFELRTSSSAHPQIRELMVPLESELHAKLPDIF